MKMLKKAREQDNWFLTVNHAGHVIDQCPAVGSQWTIAPFGEHTRFKCEVAALLVSPEGESLVIICPESFRDEVVGARQWFLMKPIYVGMAERS